MLDYPRNLATREILVHRPPSVSTIRPNHQDIWRATGSSLQPERIEGVYGQQGYSSPSPAFWSGTYVPRTDYLVEAQPVWTSARQSIEYTSQTATSATRPLVQTLNLKREGLPNPFIPTLATSNVRIQGTQRDPGSSRFGALHSLLDELRVKKQTDRHSREQLDKSLQEKRNQLRVYQPGEKVDYLQMLREKISTRRTRSARTSAIHDLDRV